MEEVVKPPSRQWQARLASALQWKPPTAGSVVVQVPRQPASVALFAAWMSLTLLALFRPKFALQNDDPAKLNWATIVLISMLGGGLVYATPVVLSWLPASKK
jgi:hypothetical protein